MVEELNETMQSVVSCIEGNRNFLLQAGAGSGKTYSLIQTINYIKKKYPNRKILCITYTNNAKDEIIERLNDNSNITVSTIHDFIWGFIKNFQKDLIVQTEIMIADEKEKLDINIADATRILANPTSRTNIENKQDELNNSNRKREKYNTVDFSKGIRYLQYKALYRGVLWHDDVLNVFTKFSDNPTFCKMLINSFSYIFIDECQDTSEEVITKLLNVVNEYKDDNYLVVGLYGDCMQEIYDKSIGAIDCQQYNLTLINKTENYRSCNEIIRINNKLRNDGLTQLCSDNSIIKSSIKFIYNRSDDKYLKNYDEIDISLFKRLFLGHKQIAEEVGFLNIYNAVQERHPLNSSEILKKEDERFLEFINAKLMSLKYDFDNGNYSQIINQLKIENYNKLELLVKKDIIYQIFNNLDIPIKDFIEKSIENKLLRRKDYNEILETYTDTLDEEYINKLLEIQSKEYYNYFLQARDKTMLETMHGVKGNEFEHIIINIDGVRGWSKYDFPSFLSVNTGIKDSVKERTHKLLYVACTRAKSSLVINYIVDEGTPIEEKQAIQNGILQLFGELLEFVEYKNEEC